MEAKSMKNEEKFPMFSLEPKIENPIILHFTEYGAQVSFAYHPDRYDAEKGVVFAFPTHYGIIVERTVDGKQTRTAYGTQCPIAGMQKDGNSLRVFENNKYPHAWKFDKQGLMLSRAEFYQGWTPSREFLWKQYNVNTNEFKYISQDLSSQDVDKFLNDLIKAVNKANNVTVVNYQLTTPETTPHRKSKRAEARVK